MLGLLWRSLVAPVYEILSYMSVNIFNFEPPSMLIISKTIRIFIINRVQVKILPHRLFIDGITYIWEYIIIDLSYISKMFKTKEHEEKKVKNATVIN